MEYWTRTLEGDKLHCGVSESKIVPLCTAMLIVCIVVIKTFAEAGFSSIGLSPTLTITATPPPMDTSTVTPIPSAFVAPTSTTAPVD